MKERKKERTMKISYEVNRFSSECLVAVYKMLLPNIDWIFRDGRSSMVSSDDVNASWDVGDKK